MQTLSVCLACLVAGAALAAPPSIALQPPPALKLDVAWQPDTHAFSGIPHPSVDPMLQPPPPSGTGAIITGWILTGVGALNLVTLPLCYSSIYPEDGAQVCKVSSLVLAGGTLIVGVPLLAVGYSNRKAHRAWKNRDKVSQRRVSADVMVAVDGLRVGFRVGL